MSYHVGKLPVTIAKCLLHSGCCYGWTACLLCYEYNVPTHNMLLYIVILTTCDKIIKYYMGRNLPRT